MSGVLVMLAALLLGALAAGALTVVVTALPGLPEAGRSAAAPGSAVVIFAVLLFRARVLLARPAPVRALWPAAVLGAAAVTLALSLGAPVLARLVSKNASPLPGSGSASLPAIHPRPATPRPDQAVPGNPDQHFDQCPPLPDAGEMQAL
jgi:hypothetical protein